LVPLPIGSFTGQIAKGGRRSIPLYRSATESALGLLPSVWPYPRLSSELMYWDGKIGVCGL
jgi:hypothetical protein